MNKIKFKSSMIVNFLNGVEEFIDNFGVEDIKVALNEIMDRAKMIIQTQDNIDKELSNNNIRKEEVK